MSRPEKILFLSDARGIYIPRDFANSWDTPADRAQHVEGVEPDDWAVLEAGPDHELYWDTWLGVCESAVVLDRHGNEYHIDQDGDCWLIPVGMEWDEEAEGWRWPHNNVVPFPNKRSNQR